MAEAESKACFVGENVFKDDGISNSLLMSEAVIDCVEVNSFDITVSVGDVVIELVVNVEFVRHSEVKVSINSEAVFMLFSEEDMSADSEEEWFSRVCTKV